MARWISASSKAAWKAISGESPTQRSKAASACAGSTPARCAPTPMPCSRMLALSAGRVVLAQHHLEAVAQRRCAARRAVDAHARRRRWRAAGRARVQPAGLDVEHHPARVVGRRGAPPARRRRASQLSAGSPARCAAAAGARRAGSPSACGGRCRSSAPTSTRFGLPSCADARRGCRPSCTCRRSICRNSKRADPGLALLRRRRPARAPTASKRARVPVRRHAVRQRVQARRVDEDRRALQLQVEHRRGRRHRACRSRRASSAARGCAARCRPSA